jgi:hypothetical protein
MAESIKPIIKKIVSQNIPDENIARQKMTDFYNALKNTINDIGNNWNSKDREDFIYNQVTSLPFITEGDFILNDKACISKLKSIYNSSDPSKFTTLSLSTYFENIDVNSIYFIKEPFGSKASPDFLIISSNGILGIEDKSSKGGKVTFNTGTPGGNKFIMYYDKTDKKIYLVSGKNWGWENDIESEYKQFTKEMIIYAKNKFEERFGDRIKKMSYYARPMLVDSNKVKDIWDKDEEAVMSMLRKHI